MMADIFAKYIGEYALTGGFFILSQLFILMSFYPDTANYLFESASFGAYSAQIHNITESVLTYMLIALATISVFFFGLILDLCGSYMIFWEMRLFRRGVAKNEKWIKELITYEFYDYTQKELEDFIDSVPDIDFLKTSIAELAFWRRSSWKGPVERMKQWKFLPVFRRIEQLLLVYALENVSEARLSWLSEKIRLLEQAALSQLF